MYDKSVLFVKSGYVELNLSTIYVHNVGLRFVKLT
jgi:hypothetical protein